MPDLLIIDITTVQLLEPPMDGFFFDGRFPTYKGRALFQRGGSW